MISRSQVAAARLLVAAARYQGKEDELPETTRRLARLRFEDLPSDAGVEAMGGEKKSRPTAGSHERGKESKDRERPGRGRGGYYIEKLVLHPEETSNRRMGLRIPFDPIHLLFHNDKPYKVISSEPVDLDVDVSAAKMLTRLSHLGTFGRTQVIADAISKKETPSSD